MSNFSNLKNTERNNNQYYASTEQRTLLQIIVQMHNSQQLLINIILSMTGSNVYSAWNLEKNKTEAQDQTKRNCWFGRNCKYAAAGRCRYKHSYASCYDFSVKGNVKNMDSTTNSDKKSDEETKTNLNRFQNEVETSLKQSRDSIKNRGRVLKNGKSIYTTNKPEGKLKSFALYNNQKTSKILKETKVSKIKNIKNFKNKKFKIETLTNSNNNKISIPKTTNFIKQNSKFYNEKTNSFLKSCKNKTPINETVKENNLNRKLSTKSISKMKLENQKTNIGSSEYYKKWQKWSKDVEESSEYTEGPVD